MNNIRDNRYLAIGGSALLLFLCAGIRRKTMKPTIKKEDLAFKDLVTTTPVIDKEQLHKDEFMNRVRAMTMDELKMVVDYAPVELCMERITKELENAKQLKNGILGLSNSF